MSESLPKLPVRRRTAHKGNFGTCLLVGGSRGMMGAIVLAGRAALRSGVGLVRLAVPASQRGTLPAAVPEATSIGLFEQEGAIARGALRVLVRAVTDVQAVGVGPGLSCADSVRSMVPTLVEHTPCPLVLDADALNVLVGSLDVIAARTEPTVITPHPGEAARLLELESSAQVQVAREESARRLADSTGAVVILKGHQTVIQDGDRLWVNVTGNAGMATGASGDVLTGIVTALLAQGMSAYDAARLGVHAHGLAGDLAIETGSQTGLIAGDLVDRLPEVWRRLGEEVA